MYEAFFQLKRRPFAAMPDPQCWYHCERYQAVLDELLVCADQGQGVGIFVTAAGLGKSLLCERLVRDIGEPYTSVLLRHATFQSRRGFLQTLLAELAQPYDLPSDQELRLSLIRVLRDLDQNGRALLLVIDEAHQLSEKILEEVRILADQAVEGRPIVRLILCGQLSLEDKLAHPQLQALNQRVRSHLSLTSLTLAESADYIDYRITWAGGRTNELFAPETLAAICRAADGNPRCLNQLCDHLLLLAYVAEQRPVPLDLVYDALEDLQHLPLSWNALDRHSAFAETRGSVADRTSANDLPTTSDGVLEFGENSLEFETLSEIVSSEKSIATERTTDDSTTEGVFDEQPAEADKPAEDCEIATPAASEDSGNDPRQEAHWMAASVEDLDPAADEWIEELVIDRYNALDAGFPAPEESAQVSQELPTAEEQTPDSSIPSVVPPATTLAHNQSIDMFEQSAADLLKMPGSIDSRLEIIQQILDYAIDDVANQADVAHQEHDAETPAPASRTPISLDSGSRRPQAITPVNVEDIESFLEAVESQTAEVETAGAGFSNDALPEMLSDQEIADAVENQRLDDEGMTTAPISQTNWSEDFAQPPTPRSQASVIEIGAPAANESEENSGRTERERRPIKNLFTLLRRKQQGRL